MTKEELIKGCIVKSYNEYNKKYFYGILMTIHDSGYVDVLGIDHCLPFKYDEVEYCTKEEVINFVNLIF